MAVYLNKDTGEVTTTKPSRAKVLVAEGHEVPAAIQDLLNGPTTPEAPAEQAEAEQAEPSPEAPAGDVEPVTEPKRPRRRA